MKLIITKVTQTVKCTTIFSNDFLTFFMKYAVFI